MEHTKDLSIVISLFNEEESLPELISWIEKVTAEQEYKYEIILVDDGSSDGSWNIIRQLSEKNTAIRGIFSAETTENQQLSTMDSKQRKDGS